jgi:MFS family permease
VALLGLPWTIKPLFGLLSDFVPLFGSRRRNYLLLANGAAAVSLFLLAFVPIEPGSLWLLFALLLPTTMAIALGDVIVDALMVEKGQPLGLTGRFQSMQWAAANAALLLTGVLGGYVAQERLQSLAFGLCGALWLFAFAVAWRYAGDQEDAHLDAASLSETWAALLDPAVCLPASSVTCPEKLGCRSGRHPRTGTYRASLMAWRWDMARRRGNTIPTGSASSQARNEDHQQGSARMQSG